MQNELITFETAKLAREKGLNVECTGLFLYDGTSGYYKFPVNTNSHKLTQEPYSRPTQSLLQRWLREVHKIDLDSGTTFSKRYSFTVYIGQNPEPEFITEDFDTYEEALEQALQQSLKLIP